MSLINQMLKDLDARRAGDEPTNGLVADLAPVRSGLPSEAMSRRWFTVPLLLGCAAIAAAQLPASTWSGWRGGQGAGSLTAAAPRADARDVPVAAPPPIAPRGGDVGQLASRTPGLKLALALENAPVRDYGLDLHPELRSEAERLNAMLEQSPPAALAPSARAVAAPARVAVAAAEPAQSGSLKRALPATDAQRAEAIFDRAMSALSAGDSRRGEADLAEALAVWPGHVKAREVLAARMMGAGRAEDALDLLADGQREVPGEGAFAKLRARVLVEHDRLEEALRVLVEAPAEAVRDAQYHALEAAIAQRLARHGEAVAAYRRALQAKPSAALWWMGLGISLEAMRQDADALRAFRQAAASPGLAGEVRRYVESRIRSLRS